MNDSKSDSINEISGNDGLVGVYIEETDSTRRSVQFWSEEEKKYMNQLFEANIHKVGPSKQFRVKRNMWVHIAEELSEKFDRNFTGAQVENRYKTEQRQKRNRNLNVSSRKVFSYEQELEQTMDMEHSMSPEVEIERDTTSVRKTEAVSDDYFNSNQMPSAPSPPFLFGDTNDNIILKYMQQQQEIFKEKEERKQRRHDEKMAVLKGIGESLQRLLERKKKYSS